MLKYLLEKEFKQIVRNRFLPGLILVYPVMMMILMPWAANLDVKNIRVSIVDNDRTTMSTQLCGKVEGSAYFPQSLYADNYSDALELIERGRADIILEIPVGFEKNSINGLNNEVFIASNAVDGIRGSIAASYLASICSEKTNIRISSEILFNPSMDYKLYMVPALMVILVTIIGGFLPALNIVGEKESGTIEQINVSPASKLIFVLSKLIPYWIIGFIVLTSSLILARLIYGIVPEGSIAEFYILSFLYLLVVSGMGLVISNYSQTMQQAMFVMFFFMLIMILMSGLFTPIGSMPDWAKAIASLNPMKYFTGVMRMLFLRGSRISDLTNEVLSLSLFAVVLNSWAVMSYRKSS